MLGPTSRQSRLRAQHDAASRPGHRDHGAPTGASHPSWGQWSNCPQCLAEQQTGPATPVRVGGGYVIHDPTDDAVPPVTRWCTTHEASRTRHHIRNFSNIGCHGPIAASEPANGPGYLWYKSAYPTVRYQQAADSQKWHRLPDTRRRRSGSSSSGIGARVGGIGGPRSTTRGSRRGSARRRNSSRGFDWDVVGGYDDAAGVVVHAGGVTDDGGASGHADAAVDASGSTILTSNGGSGSGGSSDGTGHGVGDPNSDGVAAEADAPAGPQASAASGAAVAPTTSIAPSVPTSTPAVYLCPPPQQAEPPLGFGGNGGVSAGTTTTSSGGSGAAWASDSRYSDLLHSRRHSGVHSDVGGSQPAHVRNDVWDSGVSGISGGDRDGVDDHVTHARTTVHGSSATMGASSGGYSHSGGRDAGGDPSARSSRSATDHVKLQWAPRDDGSSAPWYASASSSFPPRSQPRPQAPAVSQHVNRWIDDSDLHLSSRGQHSGVHDAAAGTGSGRGGASSSGASGLQWFLDTTTEHTVHESTRRVAGTMVPGIVFPPIRAIATGAVPSAPPQPSMTVAVPLQAFQGVEDDEGVVGAPPAVTAVWAAAAPTPALHQHGRHRRQARCHHERDKRCSGHDHHQRHHQRHHDHGGDPSCARGTRHRSGSRASRRHKHGPGNTVSPSRSAQPPVASSGAPGVDDDQSADVDAQRQRRHGTQPPVADAAAPGDTWADLLASGRGTRAASRRARDGSRRSRSASGSRARRRSPTARDAVPAAHGQASREDTRAAHASGAAAASLAPSNAATTARSTMGAAVPFSTPPSVHMTVQEVQASVLATVPCGQCGHGLQLPFTVSSPGGRCRDENTAPGSVRGCSCCRRRRASSSQRRRRGGQGDKDWETSAGQPDAHHHRHHRHHRHHHHRHTRARRRGDDAAQGEVKGTQSTAAATPFHVYGRQLEAVSAMIQSLAQDRDEVRKWRRYP